MKIEVVKDFFQNLKSKALRLVSGLGALKLGLRALGLGPCQVENIQKQSQKTLDALDGVLEALDSSVTAVVEHLQEGKAKCREGLGFLNPPSRIRDDFTGYS